jgi:hypothetical protein
VQTVDLSFLSDTPERKFEKEIRLGKETARLEVSFNAFIWVNRCRIYITYDGLRRRESCHIYRLEAVPATLTRRILRLGVTEGYMLRLTSAYAEILEAVRPIEHGDLHTDTGAYDE